MRWWWLTTLTTTKTATSARQESGKLTKKRFSRDKHLRTHSYHMPDPTTQRHIHKRPSSLTVRGKSVSANLVGGFIQTIATSTFNLSLTYKWAGLDATGEQGWCLAIVDGSEDVNSENARLSWIRERADQDSDFEGEHWIIHSCHFIAVIYNSNFVDW